MWGVSGHVGIHICPLSALQSASIHSMSHWQSAVTRKWGYIQKIKPNRGDKGWGGRAVARCCVWDARFVGEPHSNDPELWRTPLWSCSHLSVTLWPLLTNSCLAVGAQSICAISLNLSQASPLIPKYTGSLKKMRGRSPALSHLQEAEKGIHPSALPSAPYINSQPRRRLHSNPAVPRLWPCAAMSLTLFVSYPFMPDSPLSTHLSVCLSLSLSLSFSLSLSLFLSLSLSLSVSLSVSLSLSLSLSLFPSSLWRIWVSPGGARRPSPSLRSSHLLFFPSIHPKGIHLCVIFLANRFRQSH